MDENDIPAASLMPAVCVAAVDPAYEDLTMTVTAYKWSECSFSAGYKFSNMCMATLQTVKTRFVKAANGVTFAYRRLGPGSGIPLVLHIHFRANMDFWDPLFINTIAAARPVIIFDQAGVGRSTGTVPTTFQGWASDVIAFVEALELSLIDLFGFSLGGVAVQAVALTRPDLVRQLILAGTTASKPLKVVPGIVWPRERAPLEPFQQLSTAVSIQEGKDAIAFSFFPGNDTGRQHANEYWERIKEREAESLKLELLDRDAGGKNQAAAVTNRDQNDSATWFHRLRELRMPTLVANGNDDVLIPTSRSWELLTQIENAQLIIYPRSGHGFLWQYAEQFASDVNRFLDHGARTLSQSKL